MSNETFFKCFKQNKIFFINIFWKLGVNAGFFSKFIFLEKSFLHKFEKINIKNIC